MVEVEPTISSATGGDSPIITSLGGLTTIWRSIAPTNVATLRFRVGQADEDLPQRGFTRLVEQILVQSVDKSAVKVTGTTGAVITTISASGERVALNQFVNTVTETLALIASGKYPTDTIERHAQALLLSGARRRIGVIGGVMTDLYGATRFGAMNFGEFGLYQIDIDQFRLWVRRRFIRPNTVLSLHQSPTSGIKGSDLLPGLRARTVEVTPLFDGWPAIRRQPGPIGIVAPLTSRDGFGPLMAILGHAVQTHPDALRVGLSFRATYQPVSAETALALAVAHTNPGHDTTGLAIILDQLDRLADQGPDPAEIRRVSDAWTTQHHDHQSAVALLATNSENLLFGAPVKSDTEIDAELGWLSAETLADRASTLRTVLAARAPIDSDWQDHRLQVVGDRNDPPLASGQVVAPVPPTGLNPWRATRANSERASSSQPSSQASSQSTSLTLDTRAVSLLNPAGRRTTIHAGQAEIMLEWADGTATLVSKTSDTITVLPGRWHDESLVKSRWRSWLAPYQIKKIGLRSVPPQPVPIPVRLTPRRFVPVTAAVLGLVAVAVALMAMTATPQSPFSTAAKITLAAFFIVILAAIGLWARRRHHQMAGLHVYTGTVPEIGIDPDISYDDRFGEPFDASGPLLASWLAQHRLLAHWVEVGAHAGLDSFRQGQITATDLYRQLGGVISSDMVLPLVNPFLLYLHMPDSSTTIMGELTAELARRLKSPNFANDLITTSEFDRQLQARLDSLAHWRHRWAPNLAAHITRQRQLATW